MSDFNPSQMGQDMAAWAARMAAQQGQGGSGISIIGWLMGLIGKDVNPGATMSIQGQGLLKADGKMQYRAPVRESCVRKLAKELKGEGIYEGIRKCNAPVSQSPTESITGPSISRATAGMDAGGMNMYP